MVARYIALCFKYAKYMCLMLRAQYVSRSTLTMCDWTHTPRACPGMNQRLLPTFPKDNRQPYDMMYGYVIHLIRSLGNRYPNWTHTLESGSGQQRHGAY